MSIYKPLDEKDGHRRYQLTSPVDLEPDGELICATTAEVNDAVSKAREMQPAWARLSFKERAEYMKKMSDLILDKQDLIIDTVIRETGKTRNDAFTMEIFSSCDSLCYYAKNTARFLRPKRPSAHGVMRFMKRIEWLYKPLGVVGIITPWNGPFILALNQSCQALMAGNTVVVKGSEVTPKSTALVAQLFREAGLPDGVMQVLTGDGQTGAELIASGVDKISFTGSVATGRKVGEASARQLIPCTLELGGKDAMIVCADSNLDRAAQGAIVGSCMNSGHYCCGTERIYVVESVYDSFVDKVKTQMQELQQGPQHGDAEDVGGIFWDRQMEIIEAHMKDAVDRGAKVLVGGSRNPEQKGLYYLPTLVVDVDHDMEIMRSETFGPVVTVMKVKNEAEAIRLANDSDYGLSGTIWTADTQKARRLAEELHTGSVCINDMTVTYGIPASPFGGVKSSGIGLVNGEIGVRGYCQLKPVIYEKAHRKPMQNAYPNSAERLQGMKKFATFLWQKTPLGGWLS